MKPYTVRQVDDQGDVVSERHVEAANTDQALRQLTDITETTQRIEVLDSDQERVRQIGADYWRHKFRRNRR